jgi:hypothetical protein
MSYSFVILELVTYLVKKNCAVELLVSFASTRMLTIFLNKGKDVRTPISSLLAVSIPYS